MLVEPPELSAGGFACKRGRFAFFLIRVGCPLDLFRSLFVLGDFVFKPLFQPACSGIRSELPGSGRCGAMILCTLRTQRTALRISFSKSGTRGGPYLFRSPAPTWSRPEALAILDGRDGWPHRYWSCGTSGSARFQTAPGVGARRSTPQHRLWWRMG